MTCAQLPTSQCDQLNIHLRGELSLGLHRAMNGCMNVRAESDDEGNSSIKGTKSFEDDTCLVLPSPKLDEDLS